MTCEGQEEKKDHEDGRGLRLLLLLSSMLSCQAGRGGKRGEMPFPRELRRVPHSAINASRTPAFLLSSLPLLLPLPCDSLCFPSFLAVF